MSEKIYCGNGRTVKTSYGNLLKLSFSEDDLKKLVANLSNGWVNADVKERRNPSEKGVTHYLIVDNWKPEGGGITDAEIVTESKDEKMKREAIAARKVLDESGQDLPF